MTPMAHISLVSCQLRFSRLLDVHSVHWLAMSALVEYLRCHVTRRAACGREYMELLFIHNPAQAKICDQKICVVLRRSEQQVLWLEISMYDPMIVQVCDGGESGSNQVRSVSLIIGAFATDAIEELAAKGEVGNEIH